MSSDTLRRSAALMRERARAANTAESRTPYSDARFPPVPESQWGDLVENYLGGTMGTHCASWPPALALAVADWLDAAADESEMPLNRPGGIVGCVDRHALAVAVAYLGDHHAVAPANSSAFNPEFAGSPEARVERPDEDAPHESA